MIFVIIVICYYYCYRVGLLVMDPLTSVDARTFHDNNDDDHNYDDNIAVAFVVFVVLVVIKVSI